ncbi:CAP domain-containing protein [Sansalvadorimonas sp. 2012CJ34-2]|uniref:CAP domain-containing protein n=1 Tax=Parendozoicomonas callyspongiae TaxID=2942213 RepID=A0ABT0PGD4_9GAMM|nr:CAP domain-containing protein [Sansalvadorimonas sp. 2012CJ34-2]MCL6270437.1 CAP domain-containing protein [Sansalvadorimonas sp. 2012CJ34-2]
MRLRKGVIAYGCVIPTTLILSAGVQANDVLDQINQARISNGLVPLKLQSQLQKAAQSHAHYMAINQISGHEEELGKGGFTGAGCSERVMAAGYASGKCSENISYGQALWRDSVENLFSAIYHRMGFLCFDFDEIGMAADKSAFKAKTSEHPAYYAYVMGNSFLRAACSQKSVSAGFYGMCRDRELVVNQYEYEKAENELFRKSAGMVIYPWDNQRDVPPAFENNEHPDPVPGIEITGQPVSVHFNPHLYRNKKIVVESFELWDQNNNTVALLPQKDKVSDSLNGIFTDFDFAWFPERPLLWDSLYNAQLVYKVNGISHKKEWSFRTRSLPFSHKIVVNHPGQKNHVKAGVEYAVILSPELSHSRIMSLKLEGCYAGDKCSVKAHNFNVASVIQRGSTTLTFRLHDGTHYTASFVAN